MKRLLWAIAALVAAALIVTTASAAPLGGPQAPATKRPSPTHPAPSAQKSDSVEQLLSEYQMRFNKNDAKALAALYVENALRLGLNGEVLQGRAAIEQFYVQSFGGTPGRLSVQPGRTQMITPDVAVLEGRYEVAGATGIHGIYIVTAVRQSGRWRLASVVPVPDRQ